MLVPEGGFGRHDTHGIEAMRGQSRRENGRDIIRWCFADLVTAALFEKEFGRAADGGTNFPSRVKKLLAYGSPHPQPAPGRNGAAVPPGWRPQLCLAEIHNHRFQVIAVQALEYALIVTFLFRRFDNRKQHGRAAVRTVPRCGKFLRRIKTVRLGHGVPTRTVLIFRK